MVSVQGVARGQAEGPHGEVAWRDGDELGRGGQEPEPGNEKAGKKSLRPLNAATYNDENNRRTCASTYTGFTESPNLYLKYILVGA